MKYFLFYEIKRSFFFKNLWIITRKKLSLEAVIFTNLLISTSFPSFSFPVARIHKIIPSCRQRESTIGERSFTERSRCKYKNLGKTEENRIDSRKIRRKEGSEIETNKIR